VIKGGRFRSRDHIGVIRDFTLIGGLNGFGCAHHHMIVRRVAVHDPERLMSEADFGVTPPVKRDYLVEINVMGQDKHLFDLAGAGFSFIGELLSATGAPWS